MARARRVGGVGSGQTAAAARAVSTGAARVAAVPRPTACGLLRLVACWVAFVLEGRCLVAHQKRGVEMARTAIIRLIERRAAGVRSVLDT